MSIELNEIEEQEQWLHEEEEFDEEDKFCELFNKYAELSHSIDGKQLMKLATRKDKAPTKIPNSWEFITRLNNVDVYKIGKTVTILDNTNSVFVRLSIRKKYILNNGEEQLILKGKAEAAGFRAAHFIYVGIKLKELTELKKLAQEIVTYQLSTGEISIEEEN